MDVRPAETEGEIEEVRRLFRSFLSWHRQRHTEDLALIEAYFDDAAYDAEIENLPGAYAPPDGALLVPPLQGHGDESQSGLPADEEGEMKRMFVPAMARGRGAGRALAEAVIARARAAGYRRMYLDTSVRQTEAIALYRDLGFEEVEPYDEVPEKLLGWLAFYRLDL